MIAEPVIRKVKAKTKRGSNSHLHSLGSPQVRGGGTRAQSNGVNWGNLWISTLSRFPWVQQTPPRSHKWRGGSQSLEDGEAVVSDDDPTGTT